jgi:hypothetical protein
MRAGSGAVGLGARQGSQPKEEEGRGNEEVEKGNEEKEKERKGNRKRKIRKEK